MNFIYFKIYIFFILFDTFISSNTNIPRTNNNKKNNPKNVTTDITPLGPVPDIITLDYIRELLIHIQLIKDEVIKEKLKKIKLLKKQSKDNKNDKDLKKEIDHLEKEIIDTRLLCKDYIKNELKEIKVLKDQIVKDKIEQYRWNKDKLIDSELNKLFLQAQMKRDKILYEQNMKKQLENPVLQKEIFKTDRIILKILQKIYNFFTEFIKNIPQLEFSFPKYSISKYFTEIINDIPKVELTSDSNFISIYIIEIIKKILELKLAFEKYYMNYFYNKIIKYIPEVELSFGKYLDDKLKKIHNKVFKRKSKCKSKRKSRTFFQVWSAFHDWLEEKAIKYHIGAYTFFFAVIFTMAKVLKVVIETCVAASPDISSIVIGILLMIICTILLIFFLYTVYILISDYIKSKRE
ncbi:PIR protein [Plasmodium sp. gorilla clade G2]|uniref:PIR protein n=1 Tax=Plasmodium sp. gorilla clade G2 TaxID=880535 RepID=UPI000D2BABBE|nr:PIR protein [Plasmodium sp. gorilla clade G2]SOV20007.1 PIR protein [Plasmodium sp. gorilla clade G2]